MMVKPAKRDAKSNAVLLVVAIAVLLVGSIVVSEYVYGPTAGVFSNLAKPSYTEIRTPFILSAIGKTGWRACNDATGGIDAVRQFCRYAGYEDVEPKGCYYYHTFQAPRYDWTPSSTPPYMVQGTYKESGTGINKIRCKGILQQKFKLTVSSGYSVLGSVKSVPAGIDCGKDCSEEYAPGTKVTLEATPEESNGGKFSGWGGACSGTERKCTVAMDSSRSVIAAFADKTGSVASNVVEKVKPVVSASVNPSSPKINQQFTITATASDDIAISSLEIYIGNSLKTRCFIYAISGTCDFASKYPGTGTYFYYARTVDTSGNIGYSATKSFKVVAN